ncbi:hypothetical protein MKW92_015820 [Papaver armeniacum]|nr:hypothetical protein MKW92_015820 [Papaver armeniacum]
MASSSTRFQFMFMALFIILDTWVSHAMSSRVVLLHEPTMVDRHQQWMTRYAKVYKNQAEKEKRFNIFKANVEFIESSNVGSKPYRLSVNEFSDQTIEEFKSSRNGYKRSWRRSPQESTAFKYENVIAVPSTMDWRNKGVLHQLRTKGRCCWAFSAVAAMEGITQLATKNRGLTTEANYPYNGVDGSCNTKKANAHAASIDGYEDLPANNEASLLKAISNQLVSVSIDASGQDFQFYSSGVFTGTCRTELYHGVTAVGYVTDSDGTKYWLVKKSWGTSWGEDGYIRMQRNVDANEGLCGIAMEASYPTA